MGHSASVATIATVRVPFSSSTEGWGGLASSSRSTPTDCWATVDTEDRTQAHHMPNTDETLAQEDALFFTLYSEA
jgi:hypothetical protein